MTSALADEPGRRGGALHPAFGALVAVAAWLAGGSASAEQPSAKLCRSATSTPETTACLHAAASDADARLNAAYRKAMGVIEDSDTAPDRKAVWREQLQTAQRAWIAFRDADCGDLVVSEWSSGTGANAAIAACRYDKTVQRTAGLLNRYPLR